MLNSENISIFGLGNIPTFKSGGEIHIKKKNRGKFTKSAKAAGESVLEHAAKVLRDPNATPLQKKRANFARNAAKWKHKNGGCLLNNPIPRKFQIGGYILPANVYNTFAGRKVLREDPDGGRKALDEGSKTLARGFNWLMGKAGNVFTGLLASTAVPSGSATGANVYANSPMYRYNLTNVQPGARRAIETAAPYVSPSNYIAAMTLGSLNPRVGAEVLASDPRLQSLGIVGDLLAFKYAPKAAGTVVKGGKAYILSNEINRAVKNTDLTPKAKPKLNMIALRASKISDKVFDKLYQRAIESGDPARIKAVRDLHFSARTPDNHFVDRKGLPELHYHGTRFKFNEFKREKILSNSAGVGVYTTPKRSIAEGYMNEAFPDSHVKDVYIYGRTPYTGPREGAVYLGEKPWAKYQLMYSDFVDRVKNAYSLYKAQKGKVDWTTRLYLWTNPDMKMDILRELVPYRGGTKTFGQLYKGLEEDYPLSFGNLKQADSYSYRVYNNPNYYPQDVILDPGRIKLSNPITYDDFGNIIPISMRDNFSIRDIRYRKGGKTHKPFGHRSILDNGWQSTKQLKNTKNVYSRK